MVQSGKGSNSDGRVFIAEGIVEILNNMNGLTLTIRSNSGNLYFNTRPKSKSYGCSPEILSLILLLLADGSISVGGNIS